MFKYGHVSKMTQAYIHWHKCLCGQFKGQLGITGLGIERNVASSESGGFWAAQERRRKCHSSKNMHPNILQFSETNGSRRNLTLVAETATFKDFFHFENALQHVNISISMICPKWQVALSIQHEWIGNLTIRLEKDYYHYISCIIKISTLRLPITF